MQQALYMLLSEGFYTANPFTLIKFKNKYFDSKHQPLIWNMTYKADGLSYSLTWIIKLLN